MDPFPLTLLLVLVAPPTPPAYFPIFVIIDCGVDDDGDCVGIPPYTPTFVRYAFADDGGGSLVSFGWAPLLPFFWSPPCFILLFPRALISSLAAIADHTLSFLLSNCAAGSGVVSRSSSFSVMDSATSKSELLTPSIGCGRAVGSSVDGPKDIAAAAFPCSFQHKPPIFVIVPSPLVDGIAHE
jgi:hypothetical protein